MRLATDIGVLATSLKVDGGGVPAADAIEKTYRQTIESYLRIAQGQMKKLAEYKASREVPA
jgi:hypothetical protein